MKNRRKKESFTPTPENSSARICSSSLTATLEEGPFYDRSREDIKTPAPKSPAGGPDPVARLLRALVRLLRLRRGAAAAEATAPSAGADKPGRGGGGGGARPPTRPRPRPRHRPRHRPRPRPRPATGGAPQLLAGCLPAFQLPAIRSEEMQMTAGISTERCVLRKRGRLARPRSPEQSSTWGVTPLSGGGRVGDASWTLWCGDIDRNPGFSSWVVLLYERARLPRFAPDLACFAWSLHI